MRQNKRLNSQHRQETDCIHHHFQKPYKIFKLKTLQKATLFSTTQTILDGPEKQYLKNKKPFTFYFPAQRIEIQKASGFPQVQDKASDNGPSDMPR